MPKKIKRSAVIQQPAFLLLDCQHLGAVNHYTLKLAIEIVAPHTCCHREKYHHLLELRTGAQQNRLSLKQQTCLGTRTITLGFKAAARADIGATLINTITNKQHSRCRLSDAKGMKLLKAKNVRLARAPILSLPQKNDDINTKVAQETPPTTSWLLIKKQATAQSRASETWGTFVNLTLSAENKCHYEQGNSIA